MTYSNKKVIVSVIYRSPSQNNSEFDLFLPIFEKLLSEINKRKPSLCVIKGDFNARSSSWLPKDINTTEGSRLFSLTSSNGFSQLIKEPTHIQASSSSCIDLIFTDQPNLSVNSSVHASRYTQIVIIKLFTLALILIFSEFNELISSTKSLYYEILAKKLNNRMFQEKAIGLF